MKKLLSLVLTFCCLITPFLFTGCKKDDTTTTEAPLYKYQGMSPEEILEKLSLEEKAAQMVQGAVYRIDEEDMEEYCYGSVLSTFGSYAMNASQWRTLVLNYQQSALDSETGIPFIYGNDSVHGVNTCKGAVIFPHNINVGAANDKDLAYEMGLAVANEAKLTGMIWNFSPCIAVAKDARWGRTYESYSSDVKVVKDMATSYTKGLMDGGILPCAKHYLADGDAVYGTGENSDVERLIDRGNASLTDAEIDALLDVYKALVEDGVMSVMINHGSLNGVKMHKNEKYIKILKEDLKFNGIVISDWDSIHNIGEASLKDSVKVSINAGIDMLMEADDYDDCRKYIIELVNEKAISEERVNDAVLRILRTKKEIGLFDDPLMKEMQIDVTSTGTDEYRDIARKIAEKSLVLLKNESSVLPLAQGKKICIIGPASNDIGALCGGWTITWSGSTDADNSNSKFIPGGKTILDGFKALGDKYTIVNTPSEADVVILCVGEIPYAEWEGDTADLELTGELGLEGNLAAINLAKESGKQVVACIVAGRNVIIDEYVDDFDAVVMCYLPGSEGGSAIANVLSGVKPFTGTLPMPYYQSLGGDDIDDAIIWKEKGYKLEN